MMATKDPQTEAYVAGVCWAAGRVVAAAVEAGIAAGNLSPAARGMTPGDIATQYDEYAGERCGFEMLCESVKDESIPGEPNTEGKRKPQGVLWVCVDCLMAREAPGEGDPDSRPDREPWGLFPEGIDATHGLDCGIPDHWTLDPDGHSEDCESRSFSWSSCDGCGSRLGGERHAFTYWASDGDEGTCKREHDGFGYHLDTHDEVNPCRRHTAEAAAEDGAGEWADEPTEQSLSDTLDPEGTLMPGVVGDAWLAGVGDVMVGTWPALVTEGQVREHLARQDDEH